MIQEKYIWLKHTILNLNLTKKICYSNEVTICMKSYESVGNKYD